MSQPALKAQSQTQAAPKVATVPEWQLAKGSSEDGRTGIQGIRSSPCHAQSHTVCSIYKFPGLQTQGDGQWAIVPWTSGVAHLLGAK